MTRARRHCQAVDADSCAPAAAINDAAQASDHCEAEFVRIDTVPWRAVC